MSDKSLYVTMKITAVKDGRVWNEYELKYPNQSKEMYAEFERRISETLLKMGLDGLGEKHG